MNSITALSVPCPGCRAAIAVTAAAGIERCQTCGALVQFSSRGAGLLQANVLLQGQGASRDDKLAALETLEGMLEKLESSRAAVEGPAIPAYSLWGSRGWIGAGVLVTVASTFMLGLSGLASGIIAAPFIFFIAYCLAVLLVSYTRYSARVRSIEQHMQRQRRSKDVLDLQVETCRAHIRRLERETDQAGTKILFD